MCCISAVISEGIGDMKENRFYEISNADWANFFYEDG